MGKKEFRRMEVARSNGESPAPAMDLLAKLLPTGC
jgi:hypothetical protein